MMKSYVRNLEVLLAYDAPDYFPGHGSGDKLDSFTGGGDTWEDAVSEALDALAESYAATQSLYAMVYASAKEQALQWSLHRDGWRYYCTVRVDPAPEKMPRCFLACTAEDENGAVLFTLEDGATMLAQGDDTGAALESCWPPFADVDDVQGVSDAYADYFEPYAAAQDEAQYRGEY